MSTNNQPGIRYLPPEAGEALWIMGDQVTFKTDGTHDGLTLFVSTIPPGGGPPPHIHYLQEEAHYVLEGTFSFLNGDEWIEAPAGSFLWIPRGVRHTFRNTGAQPGGSSQATPCPEHTSAGFGMSASPLLTELLSSLPKVRLICRMC